MNYEMIGTVVLTVGMLGSMLKWMVGRFDKKFDGLRMEMKEGFDKVDLRFDKIEKEIVDIRERLTFVEAGQIYMMPADTVEANNRSEAAKATWRRRRQKALVQK